MGIFQISTMRCLLLLSAGSRSVFHYRGLDREEAGLHGMAGVAVTA